MVKPYRVVYLEEPGDKPRLFFDCMATDPDHAVELALETFPGIEVHRVDAFDHHTLFVIYSPNEAFSNDDAGYWNNQHGWVEREEATPFTEADRDTMRLPMSLGNDARWVRLDEEIRTPEGAVFLRCPNGRVYKMLENRGWISGSVRIDDDENLGLEGFLDAVSEAVTGSVAGLQDFSYRRLGDGLVFFSGQVAELDDEDLRQEYALLRASDPALRSALARQYNLLDCEVDHALRNLDNTYGPECVTAVAGTSRKIHSPAHPDTCSYVRVTVDDIEIGYWVSDEWQEDPEVVMGAVLGAAHAPR